ncbi:MAG: phenylalanyl-tRNA synthetase alpha chain [Chlamydiota bacterium]|jgi:phenylalanyl-tRNA synthetase alpha chain
MGALPQLIHELRLQFMQDLRDSNTSRELEQIKVKYLGKKGPVQSLMHELKRASVEERPQLGKLINDLKEELAAHLEHSALRLQKEEMQARFITEKLDPTLPGLQPNLGKLHPVQQMIDRVVSILVGMGFSVRLGPDVDLDHYNFGGLNFPPDHPARDMQDTFFLGPDLLLRTHTSNVQVHVMEKEKPPIRVIAPGRCFRNEDISARSHVFFHQVEGFYIDKNVSLADLFATMNEFLTQLFGQTAVTRFRPSYFPFVEPGLEVDVRCAHCQGDGCRLCKHTGWLEILGTGMIHPNVLSQAGIDPEEYSGFAWGMGIERLVIDQHKIPDIRLFTGNDLRFLKQF